MQIPLVRHPAHPSAAVEEVYVDIEYSRGLLSLWYVVQGDLGRVVMPAAAEERRADRLWQTTCFELFLRSLEPGRYREFNFSPSGEWAAYSFSAYREGMQALDVPAPPVISVGTMPWSAHEVHVTLCPEPFSAKNPALLNLAAVIEETDGAKSYWALAHPPGPPDFHHEAGFKLELPVTRRRASPRT